MCHALRLTQLFCVFSVYHTILLKRKQMSSFSDTDVSGELEDE